jgi:hypothetical protein
LSSNLKSKNKKKRKLKRKIKRSCGPILLQPAQNSPRGPARADTVSPPVSHASAPMHFPLTTPWAQVPAIPHRSRPWLAVTDRWVPVTYPSQARSRCSVGPTHQTDYPVSRVHLAMGPTRQATAPSHHGNKDLTKTPTS